MARGNKTGPMGMGPMTGRRAGFCAGYDTPGYANQIPGRGYPGGGRRFGRGRGGRGRRNRFRWQAGDLAWDEPPAAPETTREQEISWLKARTKDLQETLQHLNDRLNNLEQE